MQAAEELTGDLLEKAREAWVRGAGRALVTAKELNGLGLHKQIVNRVLEPFQWMVTLVTATDFDNFYSLRTDKDAQPEFKRVADLMLEAHNAHEPQLVGPGKWHLPFVTEEEKGTLSVAQQIRCSTARCARVSLLNHDGTTPDPAKDTALYQKLLDSHHMSPFEHQAQPAPGVHRNFTGWKHHRAMMDGDTVKDFPGLKKW